MTVLAVIAARGGSTGIPGKNIRPMLGKPLIVWTVEQALSVPEIDRVVVSTDSDDIARIASDAGAEAPFRRPPELSGSKVGKFQVWQHALAASEEAFRESYDVFVDLDCTGPLRDAADVSAVIAQLRDGRGRGVDAVMSVCAARKNPYFNLVEPDAAGALRMSKTRGPTVLARQDAPPVFEHIASVYAIDPDYLRRASHLLDGHCEGYDLGPWKGLDIDSDADFFMVEALMRRKLETAA